MIDAASIKCRLLLEFFPEKLQELVLRSEAIFNLGEFGLGESGSGLTLNFHKIGRVLAKSQMQEEVMLEMGDTSVPIKRTPDGVMVGATRGSSVYSRLVEAGLMDPDADVRARSLLEVARACWPILPDLVKWQFTIQGRALTPLEIGQILEAKSCSPIQFFAKLKASKEYSIDDLVPSSPDYYRALLPQPSPEGTFDTDLLMQHLKDAVKKNLGWGWWLTRATYVDHSVVPQKIVESTPDDLFVKIATQNAARTPNGMLAEVCVALARTSTLEMASLIEIRARSIEKMARSDEGEDPADLVAAFLRLTLAKVVYLFPTADIVWRRMVSIAHANLLAEVLHDQQGLAAAVHQHCESQQLRDIFADVWDMREGAAWQMGFEVGSNAWVRGKARMDELLHAGVLQGLNLSPELIPEYGDPDVVAFRDLILGLASPMEKPGTQRSRSEAQVLSASQSGVEQFSAPWEEKNWNTIWLLSMASILGGDLCGVIERELGRMRDAPIAGQRAQFLVAAARIAAAQANPKLADAVGKACVACGDRISEPEECSWLFQACIVAGCANTDSWVAWLKPLLLQLTYAVPKGPCSEQLAWSIDALQRLIPTAARQWNQALAAAKSAA